MFIIIIISISISSSISISITSIKYIHVKCQAQPAAKVLKQVVVKDSLSWYRMSLTTQRMMRVGERRMTRGT